MLCSRPFTRGHAEFGCGQCMPCRLNRRRLWTTRLVLESMLHESSFFLTLTYNEEHLPCDGSVSLRDAQLFLKRLREAVGDTKLRYYLVAEYGDANQRPHYHVVLYGSMPGEHRNRERGLRYSGCDCVVCRSWSKGEVFIGTVTLHSAAYVVSYVTKGLTKKTAWSSPKLAGRRPEFCTMSRRPGIAYGAVAALKDAVLDDQTGELRLVDGDVATTVRIAGKMYPIGRYLRQKLRIACGMDEKAPASVQEVREGRAEAERLAVGHREWMRVKGLRRVKSQHRAEALVRLSKERKAHEAL